MTALSGREVVAHALDAARLAGADAADAVLIEGDSTEVRVRGDAVDFVKQARGRTLGIRSLLAGKEGRSSAIASTSDLAAEAVERMARESVAVARATAPDPAAGLPEGGFAEDWEKLDLGLAHPEDRGVHVESRIQDAMDAESAARRMDDRIDNSEGSQASSGHSRITYGNSLGFLGGYESDSHSLFSEPVAHDDAGMQRDYWMTLGHSLAELENPAEVGRRAAERCLRRLGARPIPTCEVPVIFDPVTAPSLLRQLAGCVSGYAVYRKSSFLSESLGEPIASPLLTAVDDARRPGGLGSRPFDGEGQVTRRNVILEEGQLQSWLLDTYSARKLGLASTGNAIRSAGSPPSVGPSNLWFEPGKASLEEIIAETPRGLLVTELIGMGFNPVTGDYSRGAAGLWIEGGEIQHPVEEITIAANFGDMLRDVDAVGSDLLWLGRVASPSLRVSRMTVAGAG
ncbi:MAG: TldD/PmbA family protein [Myxococcota bacterium]